MPPKKDVKKGKEVEVSYIWSLNITSKRKMTTQYQQMKWTSKSPWTANMREVTTSKWSLIGSMQNLQQLMELHK